MLVNFNNLNNINFTNKLFSKKQEIPANVSERYLTRPTAKPSCDVFVRSSGIEESVQTNNSNFLITRDNFTGLRDKHYLLLRLKEKMQEAKEKNTPLRVAMFDMDNFKSINEILSYEVGDTFIQEIAHTVQNSAREHHLGSYRFGGEEFVLIFTDENPKEVNQICSSIQQSLVNNQKMRGYMEAYKTKLQKRLDEDEKETSNITRLKELKFYITAYEELAKADVSGQIKSNPAFNELLDKYKCLLEELYEEMLENASKSEKDIGIKRTLQEIYKTLKNADDFQLRSLIYNDELLDEYFAARYDKSAEIFQIKRWQRDFNNAGGFSITCGVASVEPDKIDSCTAEDILEMAGERLKEGKHEKKGKIYA